MYHAVGTSGGACRHPCSPVAADAENYPPFSGLLALPLSGESTFEFEGDDSGLLDIAGLKALGGRVPILVGLGEYPADLREYPADLRCEFLFEPRFSFFDPVRAFFRIICVLPSSHKRQSHQYRGEISRDQAVPFMV